jgi:hypothetical protein
VNATSGELPANEFNLAPFAASSLAGSSQVVGGTEGIAATPGTPAPPGSLDTPQTPTAVEGTSTLRPNSSGRVARAAAIGGGTSGPLLAIGLGGLALLAALIEADRRVMKRAHTFDVSNFEE